MAWTITPTFHKSTRIKHILGGDAMVVLKLACTSDASGGTITMRSSVVDKNDPYSDLMDAVRGSWLYLLKTVPGASAPDGTFDLDIEDENNDHILDTDANSNSATGFVTGSDTLGVYPPILDELTIVIATLGNTKQADIYLYFLK